MDLLFERQQQEKPVTATEPSTKKKAKGELKVCILTNIAAQCVLCAVDLVEFLASQIETENFICWWYNIHCTLIFPISLHYASGRPVN